MGERARLLGAITLFEVAATAHNAAATVHNADGQPSPARSRKGLHPERYAALCKSPSGQLCCILPSRLSSLSSGGPLETPLWGAPLPRRASSKNFMKCSVPWPVAPATRQRRRRPERRHKRALMVWRALWEAFASRLPSCAKGGLRVLRPLLSLSTCLGGLAAAASDERDDRERHVRRSASSRSARPAALTLWPEDADRCGRPCEGLRALGLWQPDGPARTLVCNAALRSADFLFGGVVPLLTILIRSAPWLRNNVATRRCSM